MYFQGHHVNIQRTPSMYVYCATQRWYDNGELFLLSFFFFSLFFFVGPTYWLCFMHFINTVDWEKVEYIKRIRHWDIYLCYQENYDSSSCACSNCFDFIHFCLFWVYMYTTVYLSINNQNDWKEVLAIYLSLSFYIPIFCI